MSDPSPSVETAARKDRFKALLDGSLALSAVAIASSVAALLFAAGFIGRIAAPANFGEPARAEAIDRNFALAQALRIKGTPGFIAGKEIVRGLVDLDAMKELVAKSREK